MSEVAFISKAVLPARVGMRRISLTVLPFSKEAMSVAPASEGTLMWIVSPTLYSFLSVENCNMVAVS